jgi:hypothetical protein
MGEAEGQLGLHDGNLPGIIPELLRTSRQRCRKRTGLSATSSASGSCRHSPASAAAPASPPPGSPSSDSAGRQRIGIVCINHRAVLEPDLQPVSLQAAQFEHLWFEGRLNHSPGVVETHPGNHFGSPGRIRSLLLKMLGATPSRPCPITDVPFSSSSEPTPSPSASG